MSARATELLLTIGLLLQTLAPLLDLLAGFREAVRKAAICGDHAAVLRLADVLRGIIKMSA